MEKCNRVKAVISLDAVEENFRQMRKNIASDTKMIAVIKANAQEEPIPFLLSFITLTIPIPDMSCLITGM